MRIVSFFFCGFALSTLACTVDASRAREEMRGLDPSRGGLGAYRVDVTAPAVSPGGTAHLTLHVLDPNNEAVTQFDDLHTMPMHFVAVSTDLQDFMHLHPVLDASGALSVDAPVALAQPYKLFFEYDPKGPAGAQTSRGALNPIGATAVNPGLASATAFDGSALRATVVGDTRIELQPLPHAMIMTGMTTTLRVSVKTTAGAPATDLVDWLGMPGHAIVLSEDTSTFIHAHGMAAGSGGGHGGHGGHGGDGGTADAGTLSPSDLDVDVTLPSAGLYKMFIQVKRGDRVVTAPFVLRAASM